MLFSLFKKQAISLKVTKSKDEKFIDGGIEVRIEFWTFSKLTPIQHRVKKILNFNFNVTLKILSKGEMKIVSNDDTQAAFIGQITYTYSLKHFS